MSLSRTPMGLFIRLLMVPKVLENSFTPQKCLRGGHDLCHMISWKSIRNNRVSRLTSALISNSQTAFLATVSSQGSQTGPMVFFYAFVDINNPVKALEHKRGITHSGIWTFCLTSLLHRHGERLTQLPTKIMETSTKVITDFTSEVHLQNEF